MTFAKLSDDYADDCWELSDAAFRLHTEALVWQARKLLDCRLPKSDLRRLKCGDPAVAQELVDRGFWSEYGDSYVILHHSKYQRTRDSVVNQQTRNQLNGKKSAGRPRSGGAREIWQGSERSLESQKATQKQTHTGTHVGFLDSCEQALGKSENPENTRIKNPNGLPHGNPEGMAFNRSSSTEGSFVGVAKANVALDPDTWPTDEFGLEWRMFCEDHKVTTVQGLMAASSELKTEEQARNVMVRAFPGRRF